MVQGRSVVRSVASHGYHGSFLLEQLHEALLVRGTGARHNLQVQYTVQGFFIGQGGKVGTGNAVAFRVFGLPQAYLASNLGCRARRVARHYLHTDAGRLALLHGGRHIGADGVADGYYAHE